MIYHIALPADWRQARRDGDYRVSTRGVTLAEQGYLHASTASQVDGVAGAFYADAGDLLVLSIDEVRLTSELRYEPVAGADAPYPHIYGPLNLDAVVTTTPLTPGRAFDPDAALAVHLLADLPHLVTAAGELRWREWGKPPEPTDPRFWIDATTREAGRTGLPVTWVAVTAAGGVVGTVGLDEYDLDELRDERVPWLVGMVVDPGYRRRGVGRALLAELEAYAAMDHGRLWVVTGGPGAPAYYQRCGYAPVEEVTLGSGERSVVLTKALARE